jgi:hypothetical protein
VRRRLAATRIPLENAYVLWFSYPDTFSEHIFRPFQHRIILYNLYYVQCALFYSKINILGSSGSWHCGTAYVRYFYICWASAALDGPSGFNGPYCLAAAEWTVVSISLYLLREPSMERWVLERWKLEPARRHRFLSVHSSVMSVSKPLFVTSCKWCIPVHTGRLPVCGIVLLCII